MTFESWARITSTSCSSIVITGLSEVIGSWKTIARSRPRRSRISSGLRVTRSVTVEDHLAAGDLAGRLGQEAHDRQRGDALAAARLADDPERLVRRELEGDPVDRVDPAGRRRELDPQVLDGQEPLGRRILERDQRFSRGSSASRNPSPSRLKPRTDRTIAIPGKSAVKPAPLVR